MNNGTAKVPFEELRQEALKHYEEASSAIHHWSSFVDKAIKAYNPSDQPNSVQEGEKEAVNRKFTLEQMKDAYETGELLGEHAERDGMTSQQVRQRMGEYFKNILGESI